MNKRADTMQRWLGLLCLVITAGVLNWGYIFLQAQPSRWLSIAYWTGCVLFAVAAIAFAVLDILAVRRDIRLEHRKLARRLLQEVRPAKRSEASGLTQHDRPMSLPLRHS